MPEIVERSGSGGRLRGAGVAGRAHCSATDPPGPPEHVGAALVVCDPRHDEEQVGEPVQVGERGRVDRLGLGQRDGVALGPAAGGAGDVERRRGRRAAREHEARERLEPLAQLVAGALERGHVVVGDAQPALAVPPLGVERHRQVGADVEEVVLDAHEQVGQARLEAGRDRHPDGRPGLVAGAVRPDAQIVLRHPLAVPERRLPGVASARVDAVDAHVPDTIRRIPRPRVPVHPLGVCEEDVNSRLPGSSSPPLALPKDFPCMASPTASPPTRSPT